MVAAMGEWWPYVALIVAGFLPNEVWRLLGIVFARGLDERSEIVTWVRAVAVAILAGVISKLTLFAPGALAMAPLWVRLAGVGVGFAVFLVLRRSLLAGVLAGQAVLVGGMWAFG
ncbi:MAG: AzlD domain-containing protein [Variibacter sp.]|nr:AzlD domain-containing protein [Variibacter sp.]